MNKYFKSLVVDVIKEAKKDNYYLSDYCEVNGGYIGEEPLTCCAVTELRTDDIIDIRQHLNLITDLISTLGVNQARTFVYYAPRTRDQYIQALDLCETLGFKKVMTFPSADGARQIEMWALTLTKDEIEKLCTKYGVKY